MSYRDNPAINQSLLVALSKGVGSFRFQNKEEFTPDPLLIGSAVDCLLTTPEEFESRFYISDLNFTSGVAKLIKTVYDEVDKPAYGINHYEDRLMEEAVLQDYGQSWKPETVWKKIVEQAPLWSALCLSEGKEMISKSQLPIIDFCVTNLKTHPFTSKIIGIDGEYQKEIYFKHRGLNCKALLDKIIVNNTSVNLTIGDIVVPPKSILPVDIKTVGQSVKMFPTSFQKYRYDVQAAWYMKALWEEYPGFTILPLTFVVTSTSTKEHPLIYRTNWNDLYVGKYGARIKGNKIKPYSEYKHNPDIYGYENMIDLYKEQLDLPENVRFKYDYFIYKSNGIIEKSMWDERYLVPRQV